MNGCRPLSSAEVDALLAELSARDRLLVLTGLYFGTRISETLSLTFGDLSGGYIEIRSLKQSRNATFQVPPQLAAEVESLKADYEARGIEITPTTPLFLSQKGGAVGRQQASRILVAAKRRAGLSGRVNSHSLRKTFVTRIYALTGKDIAETKKYSRHKSMANLDYYIGTSTDLSLVSQLNWGTKP